MCRVCERGGDGQDINIQESMDPGYGVCLDRIGKFHFMADTLSGGANSAPVARLRCAWGKFRDLSGILTIDRDENAVMDMWCLSER